MTLDGYFDGAKSWELDWHMYVWGEELERFSIEQLRSAGMLLFGRVTHDGMAAYWKTATGEVADYMNSLPKVVVSETLQGSDWNNTRVIRTSATDEVAKLKHEISRNIFVFGSGKLSATLAAAGLFDEFRIAIVPVILGRGSTLFGRGLPRLRLKLLESRPLSSGAVILRYEPDPARQAGEV
jgi:dihydrofolate reductase